MITRKDNGIIEKNWEHERITMHRTKRHANHTEDYEVRLNDTRSHPVAEPI